MNEQELEQKLVAAYDKMMLRIDKLIDNAEQQALPVLQKNIDKARKQAIELKELTQDEADKLGDYIQRDIHDAAHYLQRSGKEFSTWFNFDLQLIEDRILELFAKVADKTRLELAQLAEQAQEETHYRTGEITSIGTLACQKCQAVMHFKKTSRIPPCPKCSHTLFIRSNQP